MEIQVYGRIGSDVKAEHVIAKLKPGEPVTVRINSPGGSVVEALGIYNALRRHDGKVTTIVDGAGWSAASLIFLSGDERKIAAAGTLMVHNPLTTATGNANDLAKVAAGLRANEQSLASIYSESTGIPLDRIRSMLDAETWLSATEAVKLGFATAVDVVTRKMVALFDPRSFQHAPAEVTAAYQTSVATTPTERFEARVSQLVIQGQDRQSAVRQIVQDDPQLHRDYLAEFNRKAGRKAASDALSGL